MGDAERMSRLEHDRIVADGTEPDRWLYVLHGIYGAGRNWSGVARRLVRERPDWGVLLVDLREHGGSRGFDPPHTIEAAARDLADLDPAAAAILGHSFGGKVALAYAAGAPAGLEQAWLIDSTPAARPPGGSAWAMLAAARAAGDRFESRDAGVAALEERGVARPVAQWMATNLTAEDGAYRWRLDFDAMEALLLDFFAVDLWPAVEAPPPGVEVHVVKAEESSVLGPGEIDRLRAAEAAGGPVRLHVVAGGHWVNADNPDALVRLLRDHLPGAHS